MLTIVNKGTLFNELIIVENAMSNNFAHFHYRTSKYFMIGIQCWFDFFVPIRSFFTTDIFPCYVAIINFPQTQFSIKTTVICKKSRILQRFALSVLG